MLRPHEVTVFDVNGLPHRPASTEVDWDEDRCCVVCPRHGSMFELSTGTPISLPATEPVETFPVREVEGRIVLELP